MEQTWSGDIVDALIGGDIELLFLWSVVICWFNKLDSWGSWNWKGDVLSLSLIDIAELGNILLTIDFDRLFYF